MQDMIGGRIDYWCPLAASAIPQIEGKTVKAIAMMSKNRAPILPSVASAHEQGLANFEASSWYGIFTPKGTPAPILQKLNAATVAALNTPAVRQRLSEVGAEVVEPERQKPEYLQKFVEDDIKMWAAIVKAAGIQPECRGDHDGEDDHCRACAIGGLHRRGQRSELAEPADDHGGGLRRRRAGGYDRAHLRAAPERDPGPAGPGRERWRRWRHGRRRPRRQVRARRLHVPVRRARQLGAEPDALQAAALQRRHRLHPGPP